MITFNQLKQACSDNYKEYLEEEYQDEPNEIDEATNINELICILDGLGFNKNDATTFIFDSILIKE